MRCRWASLLCQAQTGVGLGVAQVETADLLEHHGVGIAHAGLLQVEDVAAPAQVGLLRQELWVEGEGATYAFTGSQTDVGSSANAFSVTAKEGTSLDNYEIAKTEGTLKVTKNTKTIVITADSGEKTYDGTALLPTQGADGTGTDAGYTYTQNVLAEGDELVVEVSGTQTNAGSSASTITSYKVMRGETEVTSYYTFGESVNGTLTVNKKALTLTSGNAEKEYDGVALTNADAEGKRGKR